MKLEQVYLHIKGEVNLVGQLKPLFVLFVKMKLKFIFGHLLDVEKIVTVGRS